MKKFLTICLLCFGSVAIAQNSTSITIDKATKSLDEKLHPNAQGISLLADIKDVLKSQKLALSDEAWTKIKFMTNSPEEADSVLTIKMDNELVKFHFKNSPVFAMSESKETQTKKSTRPGIRIKDGNDEVIINKEGITIIEDKDSIVIGEKLDSLFNRIPKKKKKNEYATPKGFNINLGINGLETLSGNTYNKDLYELRPGGSRYFSMGWTRAQTYGKNDNAAVKLGLSIGLHFSWYNFMLENDNIWTKGATQIELLPSTVSLKKSKLTASYLEIPLMPYLTFKNSKMIQYIAFGPYAGYKLRSHSKIKTDDGGKKDKEFNNFYLEPFRYGLGVNVGVKNLNGLFLRYDMNETFQAGKGPKVRAFSFGLIL
jgi:hypothetical protein